MRSNGSTELAPELFLMDNMASYPNPLSMRLLINPVGRDSHYEPLHTPQPYQLSSSELKSIAFLSQNIEDRVLQLHHTLERSESRANIHMSNI